MKKNNLVVFAAIFAILGISVNAQNVDRFTGTALIYGSGFNTRTVTANFEIRLNGYTSDADTERYAALLKEGGQSKLAQELTRLDLGKVQFNGRLGPTVVAAFRGKNGDDTKLTVVFERWLRFGELRRGARSTDYPFGVIEINFEPGKNEGQGMFIGAARIGLDKNDGGEDEIELEGFGSFPGKVFGVKQVENRLP